MIKAGIDWGSSSYRAYRFDPEFNIVETIATDAGLKFIACHDGNGISPFQSYLLDSIGHWLAPGDTILLSGMVTSRSGWQETPYLPCPANLAAMLEQSVTKTINDIKLVFMPGLSQLAPSPDVIRGEELQMLGASQALLSNPGTSDGSTEVTCVLPGTHSKWAQLNDGDVQRFHTIATGELFEILLKHSLIGAFANDAPAAGSASSSAFTDAVTQGYLSETLVSDLFSCRSGILLDVLVKEAARDRLSGLLIGHEIREGLSLLIPGFSPNNPPDIQLGLIGSNQLCERYCQALRHLCINAKQIEIDAAALGFQEISRRIQQSSTLSGTQ